MVQIDNLQRSSFNCCPLKWILSSQKPVCWSQNARKVFGDSRKDHARASPAPVSGTAPSRRQSFGWKEPQDLHNVDDGPKGEGAPAVPDCAVAFVSWRQRTKSIDWEICRNLSGCRRQGLIFLLMLTMYVMIWGKLLSFYLYAGLKIKQSSKLGLWKLTLYSADTCCTPKMMFPPWSPHWLYPNVFSVAQRSWDVHFERNHLHSRRKRKAKEWSKWPRYKVSSNYKSTSRLMSNLKACDSKRQMNANFNSCTDSQRLNASMILILSYLHLFRWEAFKQEEGVKSEAMEKLLKLIGLKNVKNSTIDIFKSALAFNKLTPKSRQANSMSFNYCFMGNAVS